ncbi:MAG: co-chaperone GroES [bacterium]
MSKKLNLTPLGGNILVRGVEEETKTTSGIVLPDTIQKEKKQKGLIVALGTGKLDKDGKKIAFNVKPGDTVIFKKYSPEEVEVEGESYLIMSEDDILAVVGK